jgi:putative membrane protein
MRRDAKTLGALALCLGMTLAAGTAAAQQTDAEILGHELAANQGEVQLGQYMASHTSNASVRSYATLLVRDHQSGVQQVRSAARSARITPATSAETGPRHDTQEIMDSVRARSGTARDRAFIDHAVGDHRKDISDTEEAIRHARAPAVKRMLQASLPTLRTHLRRAEALQRELRPRRGR